MKTHQLPKTDSIEELARFWDKHDLTEFESNLEEVAEQVFQRDGTITVRLHSDEAAAVRSIASSKGIAETDLIRTWVLEKIQSR